MAARPAPARRGPQRRARAPRGRSVVGEHFEAEVGPVAHGGHCVVRLPAPHDRVVFTRHALPGERVVLEITDGTEGDRFWRADAVEVLSASPDRVEAPCPVAGPGLCGGCDFQHVSLPAQRALKTTVVREQLRRLAGLLDAPAAVVEVEAVPGDLPQQLAGLRWRTRQRYVVLPDGTRGMRRHRSHDVVPVEDCLIAHPSAREALPGTVVEQVGEHRFAVSGDGFWQVHPGAPRVLVDTVLAMLTPRPGERVLDLYAGVGLFSAFLAEAVGPTGQVTAVEGDRTATAHVVTNVPTADVLTGDVEQVLAAAPPAASGAVDLVVLDPPRQGARRAVVEQVAARLPRAVALVACDPSAMARDVALFAEHHYRLEAVRAFDLFPMTHHVECVALLTRTGSDSG